MSAGVVLAVSSSGDIGGQTLNNVSADAVGAAVWTAGTEHWDLP